MVKVPVETWGVPIAAVASSLSEREAAKDYSVSRWPLRQRINGLVPLKVRLALQLHYTTDCEGAGRGVFKTVHVCGVGRAARRASSDDGGDGDAAID
ncbi:hypothetical protein PR002_g11536 [Phytophthora rubi]|uniref:HTH psq-type domain-containing protein n=1 Tax=Phytophthora rubi TaxID=129364 RepID=A0A6A3M2N9_9STRA|nr:hypothetical protein PR002_g11536 [Phytophthora rubi]